MSWRGDVLVENVEKYGWEKGAEIGVFRGKLFFDLLGRCPKLKMIGIDPWTVLRGSGTKEESGFAPYDNIHLKGEDITDIGAGVCRRVKEYKGRSKLYWMSSLEAVDLVSDKSLDFVVIDGDHRTAFVKADIINWMPKLKHGGMMFGHDIQMESVRKAVKSLMGYFIEEDANLWFCWKKTIMEA